jgi:hypothetical protein
MIDCSATLDMIGLHNDARRLSSVHRLSARRLSQHAVCRQPNIARFARTIVQPRLLLGGFCMVQS